jgi:hypothetical protein
VASCPDERWLESSLTDTHGRIKGVREQKQRGTSALLAVMRAVPEFGRELLSDLGAPRGKRTRIETYVEVPLEDGNGSTTCSEALPPQWRGSSQTSATISRSDSCRFQRSSGHHVSLGLSPNCFSALEVALRLP